MPDERRRRLLSLLHAADPLGELTTDRLCIVCRDALRVAGAGIMLMSDDVPRGSICTTDAISARIEELQYTLGEGPCVDAYERGEPVREPHLRHPQHHRWPAFSSAACDVGVGAVFAYPLSVGATRVGALDLYNTGAGDLDVDQHVDALVLAELAAEAVLVLQAGAPLGRLAPELAEHAELHLVVHQAAGMVAAQLDCSIPTAMIRLRAHAFGSGTPLTEVAGAVVARHLRFDGADDRDAGRS